MALKIESCGNGPNLVLLHGWGISSFVFQKIIPSLSQNLTIHCIDLPGYGSNVNEKIRFDSLIDTVKSIHEILPKKTHLLGWSLGGTIAMEYAKFYPEDLLSLITVCATPRFCEDDTEVDETERYGHKWPGISPNFIRSFSRNLTSENKDSVCEKFFGMQAMGSPTIRQDIRELRTAMNSKDKPTFDALYGGLKILETIDLREDCVNLILPILSIFGEHDCIVPDGVAAYWSKMKNATTKIYKNTAHNPFLSESQQFVEDICKFCLQNS